MLHISFFNVDCTVKFEVPAAFSYPNPLSDHVSNNSPMNGSYFFYVKQYSDSNNTPTSHFDFYLPIELP